VTLIVKSPEGMATVTNINQELIKGLTSSLELVDGFLLANLFFAKTTKPIMANNKNQKPKTLGHKIAG
jgi:hypothetical protein